MSIERYLRLIAGFFVMLSVALGYWVNPAWFIFYGFRWSEPVPIGLHQLVPHDDLSAQAWRRAGRRSARDGAEALVGRRCQGITSVIL